MCENETLKEEADERKNSPLRWTGIVYADGNNHPFCPACYDGRGKRIHLLDDTIGLGYWRCRICGEVFSLLDR